VHDILGRGKKRKRRSEIIAAVDPELIAVNYTASVISAPWNHNAKDVTSKSMEVGLLGCGWHLGCQDE
jgi:hypothetical protein